MINKSKRYWPDNTIYFITGVTSLYFPYFSECMKKKILLNQIKRATKNYSASDIIFSIASNHYHLKCHSKNDTDLAKIKQIINGGTSYEYRKSFKMKYQEMWQCTKSLQVTSDDMDWRVTGYIIGNLLKHKEVNTFQELRDNPFSSYRQIDDKYGEEFAR